MYDPPILSGANIFITVAVMLIAAVSAIIAVDVYKNTFGKKKPSDKK